MKGTTATNQDQDSTAESLETSKNSGYTDRARRRFLVTATAATGVVGAGLVAVPFLSSLKPSANARAEGAPTYVDISRIDPGQEVVVLWRGKPVRVLRRTPIMIERLTDARWRPNLRDPDSSVATQQPVYAQNATRSIRPETLVVVAACTHLGCVPSFEPEVAQPEFGADWPGGYWCPCHGSRFDFAGRVTKNVPAPTNLVVPPHRYLPSGVLEIGGDPA
jgi:ubiquinol-cytochrome c reductase iron-sulfur subunit